MLQLWSRFSVFFVMILHFFQAKKIALAGQQFARSHLMGDSIFCYYYILFKVTRLHLQSYITEILLCFKKCNQAYYYWKVLSLLLQSYWA